MKPVDVVCIIDRSGSMSSIVEDSIGGFNTFLEQQKQIPDDALFTLVLFDHEYIMVHDRIPLVQAETLSKATYVPRGQTALLDAIGRTIEHTAEQRKETKAPIENRMSIVEVDGDSKKEETKPTAIVAILTDGLENASKDYTRSRIQEMIKEREDKDGWQFVFLGAGLGSIKEAMTLGVQTKMTKNFAHTAVGTQSAFSSMNDAVSSYRTSGKVDDKWNEE